MSIPMKQNPKPIELSIIISAFTAHVAKYTSDAYKPMIILRVNFLPNLSENHDKIPAPNILPKK